MPAAPELVRELLGRSAAMQAVREAIVKAARSPAPLLILGETGTGKELCAQAIARLSGRHPFIPVNCAAIAEGVAESELFGHIRGAFTGAARTHYGLIPAADGGVLFLDEMDELTLPMQAKLLRAIELGEYRLVGSTKPRHSSFRALAATSREPAHLVATGRLREDFLYRLGAGALHMPPLRERLDDIPLLAAALLHRYQKACGADPLAMTPDAYAVLGELDWPGNVRQLRNVVEAAVWRAWPESLIRQAHLLEVIAPVPTTGAFAPLPSLAESTAQAERDAILEALRRTGGRRDTAAELLGLSHATLYRKLAKLFPAVSGTAGAHPLGGRQAPLGNGDPPLDDIPSPRPPFRRWRSTTSSTTATGPGPSTGRRAPWT